MLQLARAESGIAITGEAVDLLPVLRLLLDEFERSATGAGRIQFETKAAAWVRQIDIDAFAIVLRNLIDNALNHGAADMPVRVLLDDLGTLHVINRGPVVAEAQLRQLTDRFMRGQTKAGGSGLGLAIADTILRQAGGKLSLLSPASETADGFEAIIELPSA
jgi:two-component system OmpR family sensor kinase